MWCIKFKEISQKYIILAQVQICGVVKKCAIVASKGSVSKTLIKTKGGQNSCILVDTIDIKALIDFQMLEFPLQEKDGRFKPSPSGMNPDGIIQLKRQNKLKLFSDLGDHIRVYQNMEYPIVVKGHCQYDSSLEG